MCVVCTVMTHGSGLMEVNTYCVVLLPCVVCTVMTHGSGLTEVNTYCVVLLCVLFVP